MEDTESQLNSSDIAGVSTTTGTTTSTTEVISNMGVSVGFASHTTASECILLLLATDSGALEIVKVVLVSLMSHM